MKLTNTRCRLALLPEDQRDDILAALSLDLLGSVTVSEADDPTTELTLLRLGNLGQVRLEIDKTGENCMMFDLERQSVKAMANFLNLWLEITR